MGGVQARAGAHGARDAGRAGAHGRPGASGGPTRGRGADGGCGDPPVFRRDAGVGRAAVPAPDRPQELHRGGLTMAADTLDRRDAVSRLLRERGELLVVTGLGSATYDCAAAGDDPRNFYLWGAMGGAASVALGLALAQPG